MITEGSKRATSAVTTAPFTERTRAWGCGANGADDSHRPAALVSYPEKIKMAFIKGRALSNGRLKVKRRSE